VADRQAAEFVIFISKVNRGPAPIRNDNSGRFRFPVSLKAV
jgi:hypothetical protein